jgi:hypothetical protein
VRRDIAGPFGLGDRVGAQARHIVAGQHCPCRRGRPDDSEYHPSENATQCIYSAHHAPLYPQKYKEAVFACNRILARPAPVAIADVAATEGGAGEDASPLALHDR